MFTDHSLFISFAKSRYNVETIRNYLESILIHPFILKKHKTKSKRNTKFLKCTVTSPTDHQTLLAYNHVERGYQLKVAEFRSKEQRSFEIQQRLKRRLYIDGLPLSITEQDLRLAFQGFGKIEQIFIKIKDQRVLAYVTFLKIEDFRTCARKKENIWIRRFPEVSIEVKEALVKSEDSSNIANNGPANLEIQNREEQSHHQRDCQIQSIQRTGNIGEPNGSPFRRISARSSQSLERDWMGEPITERFCLRDIARSTHGSRFLSDCYDCYLYNTGMSYTVCPNFRINLRLKKLGRALVW
jgi:hypothetical protein